MKTTFSLSLLLLIVAVPVIAQQDKGDKEIAFQGTVSIPFENPGNNTTGILLPRFGYFLSRRNFIGLENTNFFAKGYQSAGLSLLYRFYVGRKSSRFQPYAGLAPGLSSVRRDATVQLTVTQASYNTAVQQINTLPVNQRQAQIQNLNLIVNLFKEGCLGQAINGVIVGCTPIPSTTRKVTTNDFQGSGELGVKFYLNRKFAFETSYRLIYLSMSSPYAQDIHDVRVTTASNAITASFSKTGQKDGQTRGVGGFKGNANNFLLFGFSYVF